MASPSMTSDDYHGFNKRSPHDSECESVPSRCHCDAKTMWAIVLDAVPITDKTGKWLVFPGPLNPKVDNLWADIVSMTEEGKLGFGAKIAYDEPENPAIMLYTSNHDDVEDVQRVMKEARALLEIAGISSGRTNTLKYKKDEDTKKKSFSKEGLARRGGDGLASSSHTSTYFEARGPSRDRGNEMVNTEDLGRPGRGRVWGAGTSGSGYSTGGGRAPCIFHQKPGGCRRGDSCTYSHDGHGH